MSLTDFPIILFNSATGSDTAASGAGPASAITGTTNASTNSTTITLNGTFDLSGVLQTGAHVIWFNGYGFVRINTHDGVSSIVMETAMTIAAGTTFAIGGKRATIDSTESARVLLATSSPTASGGSGRWTLSFEDNISQSATLNVTFTAGTGEMIIQSSDPTTRRTWTQTGNANFLTITSTKSLRFKHFDFVNTHATKNYVAMNSATVDVAFENCLCGNNSGTNCPKGLTSRTSGTYIVRVRNCSILRASGAGIENAAHVIVSGTEISRCGGVGISAIGTANSIRITDSIISHNTGDGINLGTLTGLGSSIYISGNVIDGNTGDGIELSGPNLTGTVIIDNNQITNNGTSGTAYGLNFSGTASHAPVVEYNNFYGNRSAAANGITLDATNLTTDPGYADRTNSVRNYAVGASMKATGFPASTATIGAGQSGTTTYVDIGASQRQESGGGYARNEGDR